jgi:hypothetical protein
METREELLRHLVIYDLLDHQFYKNKVKLIIMTKRTLSNKVVTPFLSGFELVCRLPRLIQYVIARKGPKI